MVHEKIIPLRGTTKDSYRKKESEVLEKNREYAKTLIKNQLLGSPEFEEFESFLVNPRKKITK
jgi:hypothetical protein